MGFCLNMYTTSELLPINYERASARFLLTLNFLQKMENFLKIHWLLAETKVRLQKIEN